MEKVLQWSSSPGDAGRVATPTCSLRRGAASARALRRRLTLTEKKSSPPQTTSAASTEMQAVDSPLLSPAGTVGEQPGAERLRRRESCVVRRVMLLTRWQDIGQIMHFEGKQLIDNLFKYLNIVGIAFPFLILVACFTLRIREELETQEIGF